MSLRAHYGVMARYNAWMNRNLYDAAASLPDDARRRDVGAFFRSLHGTLNHLVLTDRAWLVRFTSDPSLLPSLDGTSPAFTGRLDQELFADFPTLRREREKTDADVLRWVATLTDDVLAAPIRYHSVAYARDYEHRALVGGEPLLQPPDAPSRPGDDDPRAARPRSRDDRSRGHAAERARMSAPRRVAARRLPSGPGAH